MTAIEALISCAIAVYLIIAWGWNYPPDHPMRRALLLFRGPILYTGMWHGWNMFAPEPTHANVRLIALLYAQDGTIFAWSLAGLHTLPWWKAFLETRSRKHESNVLSMEAPTLRYSLCEWLSRECIAGRLFVHSNLRADTLDTPETLIRVPANTLIDRVELIRSVRPVLWPENLSAGSKEKPSRTVVFSFRFRKSERS